MEPSDQGGHQGDHERGMGEYGIKPRFKPGNASKVYILKLPAEVFKSQGGGRGTSSRASSLDDTSREPFIKDGRIHFKE